MNRKNCVPNSVTLPKPSNIKTSHRYQKPLCKDLQDKPSLGCSDAFEHASLIHKGGMAWKCEATRIASPGKSSPFNPLHLNRCAAGPAMASLACSLSAPCTTSALRSTFNGDSLVDNAASSHQAPQLSKGALRIEAKESRIGKAPITVPKGVTINLDGQSLTVKGPLGELARTYPREVKLTTGSDGLITVERAVESNARALQVS